MKKHIKIVSLLSLFVIASTTFFIFAKRPADDRPDTIIVKSYQNPLGTSSTSSFGVFYGKGKVVETELEGYGDSKKRQSSYLKILDAVQNLNAEGYKVTSYIETGLYNQTWVLTKN